MRTSSARATVIDKTKKNLEVLRDYGGKLCARLSDEKFPQHMPVEITEQMSQKIPVLDNQVNEEFRKEAEQIIQEVRAIISEKPLSTLNNFITTIPKRLEILVSKRSPQGSQPNWQNEQTRARLRPPNYLSGTCARHRSQPIQCTLDDKECRPSKTFGRKKE